MFFFFGVSEWVGERESLPNQPETFSKSKPFKIEMRASHFF